ncbi:FAD binding domain-containing protein [Mesorhizobium sp.]|uniref:FAD binding domain-containing protein n=1 Tax=Mesorhizobium sp. TaxID=1871066 RepID=UPI0025C45E18|nr:FAD binding domain-containing protein [Mesorhizobium sp.]
MLAGGDARLVAGGTALQLEWAKGLPKPRSLVDIGQIGGLKGITLAGNGLRIGALTTLGALERDATVREELPLLAAALRATAGPAVRNLATAGGNVAGRTGCLLPALLALDARVESSSVVGRRTLPLSEWLRQEPGGEIIEAITVPVPDAHVRWTHRKIGLRAAFTPSVIGAAGMIEIVDGQACGPPGPPLRLPAPPRRRPAKSG